MRHLRVYLLFLFLLQGVFALELNPGKKSILVADKISGDKQYIYADGHVVLNHKGIIYTAEHLKYDRLAKILTIDGEIQAKISKDNTTLRAKNFKADEKFAYAKGGISLDQKGIKYSAKSAKYDRINKKLYVKGGVTAIDTKTGSKLTSKSVIIEKRFIYSDTKIHLEHLGVSYSADHVKYDQLKKVLYINGNVVAIDKKQGSKLTSDSVIINQKFVYTNVGARLVHQGIDYRADRIKYDQENKKLYIDGNVTMVDKKEKTRLSAKSVVVDKKYILTKTGATLYHKGVVYQAQNVKYDQKLKKLYVDGNITANDTKSKALLKANSVVIDNEYLYANDDIDILHEGIRYKAKHAKYDRKNKILDIWNNVKIIDKKHGSISSSYATIDIDNDNITFRDFMFDGEKRLWASSPSAVKDKDCYHLSDANFSSCNKQNPDWHIAFKRAEYNSTDKYVKIQDAIFYAKKLPIFYLPYLAFPLLKERTTGFLMPKFGHTSKGGYLFTQPFFWAINDAVDIEFNPQIRHKRGIGLYTTLRFADSPYSHGGLRVGYFKDFDKYTKKYNVDKEAYHGFEFRYESDNILRTMRPNGFKDMLYVNIQDYNDIDYIDLQKDELMHHEYSKYRESRVNYMLYNDDYFFGIGARHFKLSSDGNNDSTIQLEPAAMLHKYTKEIAPNFTYSMDANIFNHVRREGTQALVSDFKMPFEYRYSFYSDLLKFKLTEEIYAYKADFTDVNNSDGIDDISLTSEIKIYSDVSKRYGDAMHTMEFYALYSHQNHESNYIEEYDALDESVKNNFITYKPYDDKIKFGFSHYYYTADKKLKFKQRISQVYYPEDEYKKGLFRHELAFTYKKWKFYDISEYSWRYGSLGKSRNYIKYNADKFSWIVGHDWIKDLPNDEVTKSELDAGFTYKYNKNWKFFASTTYDLREEKDYAVEYKAGFIFDRGCWNTKITYARESEYVGGELEHDDKFEIIINLLPLGGFTLN